MNGPTNNNLWFSDSVRTSSSIFKRVSVEKRMMMGSTYLLWLFHCLILVRSPDAKRGNSQQEGNGKSKARNDDSHIVNFRSSGDCEFGFVGRFGITL